MELMNMWQDADIQGNALKLQQLMLQTAMFEQEKQLQPLKFQEAQIGLQLKQHLLDQALKTDPLELEAAQTKLASEKIDLQNKPAKFQADLAQSLAATGASNSSTAFNTEHLRELQAQFPILQETAKLGLSDAQAQSKQTAVENLRKNLITNPMAEALDQAKLDEIKNRNSQFTQAMANETARVDEEKKRTELLNQADMRAQRAQKFGMVQTVANADTPEAYSRGVQQLKALAQGDPDKQFGVLVDTMPATADPKDLQQAKLQHLMNLKHRADAGDKDAMELYIQDMNGFDKKARMDYNTGQMIDPETARAKKEMDVMSRSPKGVSGALGLPSKAAQSSSNGTSGVSEDIGLNRLNDHIAARGKVMSRPAPTNDFFDSEMPEEKDPQGTKAIIETPVDPALGITLGNTKYNPGLMKFSPIADKNIKQTYGVNDDAVNEFKFLTAPAEDATVGQRSRWAWLMANITKSKNPEVLIADQFKYLSKQQVIALMEISKVLGIDTDKISELTATK